MILNYTRTMVPIHVTAVRQLIAGFLIASTTAATCIGTPRPCTGRNYKTICQAIQGCQWESKGGFFLDGSCEGTPSACHLFSNEPLLACLNQGCIYQPATQPPLRTPATTSTATDSPTQHTVSPAPTKHFGTTEPTQSVDDVPRGYLCTGTPLPTPACTGEPIYDDCSGKGEKRICDGVLGCAWTSTGSSTWDGWCSGFPTRCSELSNDVALCLSQAGCLFLTDPPDPNESFYDAIMPLDSDFVCHLPVDTFQWDEDGGFWIWTRTIACDKCRPSRDGYVCYTELTVTRLDDEHVLSHNSVMKIGASYCESYFCKDGSTAFNCEGVVVVDGPDGRVVGHDCSGVCIWKMPSGEVVTSEYQTSDPSAASTIGPSASTLTPTPGISYEMSPTGTRAPPQDTSNFQEASTQDETNDCGAKPLFRGLALGLLALAVS